MLVKKSIPTLGPSISGTKCDRDKPFFLQKEGVFWVVLRYKIGTQSYRKSPTQGVIIAEPPYHAQVWEYPTRGMSYTESTLNALSDYLVSVNHVILQHIRDFHCWAELVIGI